MPHVLIDIATDLERIDALERATGLPVVVASGELGQPRELPEAELREAIALLCNQPPTNHAAMTSLRFIQLGSAGFKQIENLGLSKRDLAVCTASGVNDVPIAEWAVLMMLALVRNLPQLFHNQTQGVWDRAAQFQTELRGKTIGLWGYGGIGRETARLASALGLRVLTLTRSGQIDQTPRFHVEGTGDDTGAIPEQVFSIDQAKRFCAGLDFLLLAIPETPGNIGLIDRGIFDALPSHAFLLNPARGGLVHETDLLDALRTGKLAGAALDTHFHYPMPPDHPLWGMPNVIMTPHISGSSLSPHFTHRLWELFIHNLRQTLAGKLPFGQLAPHQLDPA